MAQARSLHELMGFFRLSGNGGATAEPVLATSKPAPPVVSKAPPDTKSGNGDEKKSPIPAEPDFTRF